jgi:hypothetical protein
MTMLYRPAVAQLRDERRRDPAFALDLVLKTARHGAQLSGCLDQPATFDRNGRAGSVGGFGHGACRTAYRRRASAVCRQRATLDRSWSYWEL